MRTGQPSTAISIAFAALTSLVSVAAPGPALAFHAGPSLDFAGCTIWFNDAGKPLRNKLGREIGEAAPCGKRSGHKDTFTVVPGEARNTLVIRDETHHLECVLGLAPGSAYVVVPTSCQRID